MLKIVHHSGIALMKWRGCCLAAACLIYFCLAVGCYDQSSYNNQAQVSTDEILLDLHPFRPSPQLPDSLLLHFQAPDKMRVIHYSSNGLAVIAAYEGKLAEAEAATILKKLRSTAFRAELQNPRPVARKADGDLFNIRISSHSALVGELSGLVHLAPPLAGEILNQFLGLWQKLPRASLAEGYLRCESVPLSQAEKLKPADVRALKDFPIELQAVIKDAINTPFNFHVLRRVAYHSLMAHGRAFYLVADNSAYRLTLFQSGY